MQTGFKFLICRLSNHKKRSQLGQGQIKEKSPNMKLKQVTRSKCGISTSFYEDDRPPF